MIPAPTLELRAALPLILISWAPSPCCWPTCS